MVHEENKLQLNDAAAFRERFTCCRNLRHVSTKTESVWTQNSRGCLFLWFFWVPDTLL